MTRRRQQCNGYMAVWRPGHPLARKDGYVYEHRLVAYDAGLLLDPSLHVHHINHDKTDNRLANLAVLSADEHARRHAVEDGHISNQFGTWPLRPPRRIRTVRPCAGCPDLIPLTRRVDALYCTDGCRVRTFKRQQRRVASAGKEVAA